LLDKIVMRWAAVLGSQQIPTAVSAVVEFATDKIWSMIERHALSSSPQAPPEIAW
jgi:hypothetical protein